MTTLLLIYCKYAFNFLPHYQRPSLIIIGLSYNICIVYFEASKFKRSLLIFMAKNTNVFILGYRP